MDTTLNNMVLARVAEVDHLSRELRATLTAAMWRSGVAGAFYAWHFRRAAARIASDVVWMHGARAFVMEEAQLADPDEELSTGLHKLAQSVRDVRSKIVEMLPALENARIGSTRAALQRALRELAKQSGAMLKEVESFASEIAAHEADHSPHEPGWQASTSGQVRELFARL